MTTQETTAAAADQAAQTNRQFATFFVDGLFFGVEVLQVQEVLRYQEMTPVPLAPAVVEGLINWDIQILATDLSTQVLERASAAKYMQIEVNRGLPIAYLVKYFTHVGLDWQLKDEVRRLVRFIPLDLRQSMRTLGPFDIVFCRNVLIYFDLESKRKILAEIYETLFRGRLPAARRQRDDSQSERSLRAQDYRAGRVLSGALKGAACRQLFH